MSDIVPDGRLAEVHCLRNYLDPNSLAVIATAQTARIIPYIGDSYCKQYRNNFQFSFSSVLAFDLNTVYNVLK